MRIAISAADAAALIPDGASVMIGASWASVRRTVSSMRSSRAGSWIDGDRNDTAFPGVASAS